MTEYINLLHGDCLELMKDIPDKSVDLILTDPPYGIKFQSNFRKDKFDKLQNDDVVLEDWLTEAHRVLKDGGAIYTFTRWDVYPEWYSIIEKLFKIKNCIIWHKRGGGLGDLKGAYIFNHEFLIFASKGRHILKGKRCSDVWEVQKDAPSTYKHPTQKPVALMRQIIEKSSSEGQIVLDPFMGSGTTGVACVNTNRNFIGIELDDKYFDIAEQRIRESRRKLRDERAKKIDSEDDWGED